MNIIFTEHARFQMQRRGISEEVVRAVITNPVQRIIAKKDKVILQNKYINEFEQEEMLLRVVGREIEEGFIIITVYKTSKIEKYWEKEMKK